MDPEKEIYRMVQEAIANVPVIVLGSGASAAHGIPGMGALGHHLSKTAPPATSTTDELARWSDFCSILPNTDLESALTKVALSQDLTRHVVTSTWHYLVTHDVAVLRETLANPDALPLTRLYRHLFRSTTRTLSVVTTNYDRVAEYAAEIAGFNTYLGFTSGMIGHRVSGAAPVLMDGKLPARTVNIWKVHGSFSWFEDSHGVVISLPPSEPPPVGMEPVIVTPGFDKYRRTHKEPFRTIISNADKAIGAASSFLFVGYGFNDEHIQPRIVERCKDHEAPMILLTKEISEKAHEFFQSGMCKRYLALEESALGTRAYSDLFPGGLELAGHNIWQFDEFLSLFM
ncbi:SIR2 family protein [Pandoraea sp. SD6-2]|uniref:SIR2 family protein n=1 Tax=Pandoraea sp. SD6-2 TaxID=1286093 RepID=UPI001AEFE7DF|nr:SIR2 family protein [Pandoraea sp. SD6-2]